MILKQQINKIEYIEKLHINRNKYTALAID